MHLAVAAGCLGLCGALHAPAAAADTPDVQVQVQVGVFRVGAASTVAADAATAWAVLTDYDRLTEFVPDLETSRVVSAAGEPLLIGTAFMRRGVRRQLEALPGEMHKRHAAAVSSGATDPAPR